MSAGFERYVLEQHSAAEERAAASGAASSSSGTSTFRRPSRKRAARASTRFDGPAMFDDDEDAGADAKSEKNEDCLQGILDSMTKWDSNRAQGALFKLDRSEDTAHCDSIHSMILPRGAHEAAYRAAKSELYHEDGAQDGHPGEAYQADECEKKATFEQNHQARRDWARDLFGECIHSLKFWQGSLEPKKIDCSTCRKHSFVFCERTTALANAFLRLQTPWLKAMLENNRPLAIEFEDFDGFVRGQHEGRSRSLPAANALLQACESFVAVRPKAQSVVELGERLGETISAYQVHARANDRSLLNATLANVEKHIKAYLSSVEDKNVRYANLGKRARTRLRFTRFELARLSSDEVEGAEDVVNPYKDDPFLLADEKDGDGWSTAQARPNLARYSQSSAARFVSYLQSSFGTDTALAFVDGVGSMFCQPTGSGPSQFASDFVRGVALKEPAGSRDVAADMARASRAALRGFSSRAPATTCCKHPFCQANVCMFGGIVKDGLMLRPPSNSSNELWSRDLNVLPVVSCVALNGDFSRSNLSFVKSAMVREAGAAFFASKFFHKRSLTTSVQCSVLMNECAEFGNLKQREGLVALLANSAVCGFFPKYVAPCFDLNVEARTFDASGVARDLRHAFASFVCEKGNATIDAVAALRIAQFAMLAESRGEEELMYMPDGTPLMPSTDTDGKTYTLHLPSLDNEINEVLSKANSRNACWASEKDTCIKETTSAPFDKILSALRGGRCTIDGFESTSEQQPISEKDSKRFQVRCDLKLLVDHSERGIVQGNKRLVDAARRLDAMDLTLFSKLGLAGVDANDPTLPKAHTIFFPPAGAAEKLRLDSEFGIPVVRNRNAVGASRRFDSACDVLPPGSFTRSSSAIGFRTHTKSRTEVFRVGTELFYKAVQIQRDVAMLALGTRSDLPHALVVSGNAFVCTSAFLPVLESASVQRTLEKDAVKEHFKNAGFFVKSAVRAWDSLVWDDDSRSPSGRESPTKVTTREKKAEAVRRLSDSMRRARGRVDELSKNDVAFVHFAVEVSSGMEDLNRLCGYDVVSVDGDPSAALGLSALESIYRAYKLIKDDLLKFASDRKNLHVNESSVPKLDAASDNANASITQETTRKEFEAKDEDSKALFCEVEDAMRRSMLPRDSVDAAFSSTGLVVHSLSGSLRRWIMHERDAKGLFFECLRAINGSGDAQLSEDRMEAEYSRCKRAIWGRMLEEPRALDLNRVTGTCAMAFLCAHASEHGTPLEKRIASDFLENGTDYLHLGTEKLQSLNGVKLLLEKRSVESRQLEQCKSDSCDSSDEEVFRASSGGKWEIRLATEKNKNFQRELLDCLNGISEVCQNSNALGSATWFVSEVERAREFKRRVIEKSELSTEAAALFLIAYHSMGEERDALKTELYKTYRVDGTMFEKARRDTSSVLANF